jgi:hypothetical protein
MVVRVAAGEADHEEVAHGSTGARIRTRVRSRVLISAISYYTHVSSADTGTVVGVRAR